jgi:hypothetical protein
MAGVSATVATWARRSAERPSGVRRPWAAIREIRTVFNVPGRITDRPLPATRDRDGRWIGGSVGQWR